MSNGSETSGAVITGTGVVLTQTSISVVQAIGMVIGALGLLIQLYSVVTRNKHNKFLRDNHTGSSAPDRSDADPTE